VTRRSRLRALALALAALAAGCGRGDPAPGASIAASELAARLSGAAPLILDVRTREEFASGHIPGAKNLPLAELPDGLAALDASPSEEIVVHCERGGRAAQAEAMLRESGYTRLLDLDGHMQAWRAGGYPLE
jgi:rhodanese-related sulfurtransferase